MEKLLWIISLSLITSCGKKPVDQYDYDRQISRHSLVNGATWPTLIFESASTNGMMEGKLKRHEKKENEFYLSFKDQFRNRFYNIEPKETHKEIIISIADPRRAIIYPVFANLKSVKNVRLSVSTLVSPAKKLFFELNTNASPLVINADLSDLSESPFEALIKIEDFDYDLKGHTYQFASANKRLLDSHYRLMLDDGRETEVFYVQAGKSLEEAFLQYNIDYEVDRKGELSSLDHRKSANWNQDLNLLPDNTHFWRIINSPNQKLSFRPLAGQKVMAKLVNLQKLKEVASTKRKRTLKLTAPVVPAVENPEVAKRKVISVKTYLLIPKQEAKYKFYLCGPISFSGGSSMKSSFKGNFVTYSIGYEKLSIDTPAYMFSGLGKDAFVIDTRRPPVKLKTGSEYLVDDKCAKKHKSTVTSKSYAHKYDLTVVVEETMKL